MKTKIFTVPNIISAIRIALIPFFVYFYLNADIGDHYIISLSIIFFSGFSDVVDGFIARHFNMTSDLGKVLDPIADKLTQAVVLFCLLFFHKDLMPLFVVLFVKELMTLFAATILFRSGVKPISSKWFGKLSTVMVYATIVFTLVRDLLQDAVSIPNWITSILTLASIICLLISMLGYLRMFIKPPEKFD